MTDFKAERKKLNLTQVKLATKAGVSRFRYATYEQGFGDMREDEARKLNRALEKEKLRLATKQTKQV